MRVGRSDPSSKSTAFSPSYRPSIPSPRRSLIRAAARLGTAVSVGLLVANCASSQKAASRSGGIDPKYGVSASPKVVADGDPVPKGGGREIVGKPYVVAGRLYIPRDNPNYSAEGLASWYGPSFHGRMTANGEVFDRSSISVAHPTMPLPSYVRVTNLRNGYSIVARANDRGPYHGGRLADVSERVAEALDFKRLGTTRIRLDYMGRASTAGSDDEKLYASLRTDGGPAQLRSNPTLVADASGEVATPRPVVVRQPAPEPEEQPARVAAVPASVVVPAAMPVPAAGPVAAAGKPAPGIPLPPDRPFDLGASGRGAPAAALRSPVPAPVPMPIPRTAARLSTGTSLFFAEAEPDVATSFRKDDPMAGLIQQSFVPLRTKAEL